jgi:mannose-6-phosphate isomerase
MPAREGSGVAARRFDEAAVLTPLILSPIYRSYLWGGRRFETALGRKLPGDDVYAESWQLVDRGTDQSVVAAGPLAGATLGSLVSTRGRELLGRHSPQRAFPLLFKFLDACQDLSVQVHPTAAYAAANPGAHLKTEAWLVLHAEPGAAIYRGVHEHVSPAQFRRAIEEGTVVELLHRETVSAGDCIPLESGLCHALGSGVLVAEVQTPSDTTFRVFDWNRNDPARPLHVEQAMACILFGAAQRLPERPITSVARSNAAWSDGLRAAVLCANEYFEIEAIEASPSGDAAPMDCVTDHAPVVLAGQLDLALQALARRGDRA